MSARCGALLFVGMFLLASDCAGQPVRPPSPALNMRIDAGLAVPRPANEHYYILVFGSQTTPRIPKYTHTWATMVTTSEVPGFAPVLLEVNTISWLPETLDVRLFRLKVEKGINLDLYATIREMLRNGERISMWGPYETWGGLHDRFITQKAFLESNAIGYQCNDGFGEAARKGNGCNCFHSISDVDPQFDRRQYPLLFYGNPASKNIVRQMFDRPILIHPRQTHDWLIPLLGLDQCPIVHRRYEGPAQEFSPEAIRQVLASGTTPRRRLLP
jgi:hypothetical protein